MKNHETINTSKMADYGDRATFIIKAVYQEYATSQAYAASHAYDFLNMGLESAWQTVQRISPSKEQPINLGHLEGKYPILVLSHDLPKLAPNAPDMLKNAQEANSIVLTNADGVVVGLLRAKRAMVVEYPFPVFAKATTATTLLSITAIPVPPHEIVSSK
jgi:hypothetical protein